MTKIFPRADERSFTNSVARARFVWLLVAALLLPLAASLSRNSEKSERFEAFSQGGEEMTSNVNRRQCPYTSFSVAFLPQRALSPL